MSTGSLPAGDSLELVEPMTSTRSLLGGPLDRDLAVRRRVADVVGLRADDVQEFLRRRAMIAVVSSTERVVWVM